MVKEKIYKLLIWGQKYTGTDNIYLATQGSYLYIGQFISLGVGLLMAMAYARFLSKETFGEFQYLLSITAILAITSLDGMTTAILQAVARGFEGDFKKAIRAKLKWALIGSAAALLLAGYYLWKGNQHFAFAFLIITLILPFLEGFNLYIAFLQGKKRFGQSTLYQNISRIISALIVFITIFKTDNLILLLLAYFISNSLLNLFFYLWTIRKNQPNKKEDQLTIRYGRDLSFINIIPIIGKNLDRLIVFHFLGAPLLAIYHFAIMPLDKTTMLMQNLRQLAIPKLAASHPERLKAILLKKISKLFFIIIPGTILFLLIAPYLYKLFFPQYLEAVKYSRWLFLAILSFPFTFIAAAFNAQMKKAEVFKLTAYTNAVYIASLIALIPFYGIWGLIAAYLIRVFFNSGYGVYLFRKT